jgi:HlyD family secretion protein
MAGGLLAMALALLWGFLPRTQEVDLVRIGRGPLQVTLEEEGRTRLKERFVISAPRAGYLRRLAVKVGDRVSQGQAVAVLEPLKSQALDARSRAETEAVVAAAEASLAAALERERAAAADADYADKRHERTARLFARQTVARDQLDQAESEARKARALRLAAEAAVHVARSELERAKATLRGFSAGRQEGNDATAVIAPLAGSVFKLFRESEGAVQTGEPLLEIGDVRNIEVKVELLSPDAVRIAPGTKVLFKRWGGEGTLEGRVRRVEPAGFTKVSSLGVEEQRVLTLVEITSPPERWRMLGDGYRLEVHFVLWEGRDVLQAPTSSLFRLGPQWSVFLEEQGRARRRTVEIGQRTGLAAQVLSGLKEGDRVVAYPDDAIAEGVRVRQRE